MRNLPAAIVNRSFSLEAYQELFTGESTGYTEKQAGFIPLNARRMARLLKRDRLLAEARTQIKKIDRPVHLLVITEPWCGDAAQIIPLLVQMVEQNEHLQISFLLRDKELELIDAFLTNGSRSIPKIIILDPAQNYQVLGAWGPRPDEAQEMMDSGLSQWRKMAEGLEKQQFYADLYIRLQKWYTKDKAKSIQTEFLQVLENSFQNSAMPT